MILIGSNCFSIVSNNNNNNTIRRWLGWGNKTKVLCVWCFLSIPIALLMNIIAKISAKLTGRDLYSGSEPGPEKAMAPHFSALAWKILWTKEPGGLQSMGLLRVGYDWVTSLSLFTFMHWRRKWQPTPVFLPGESQGRASLVSCHLWGHTESDTTEAT